MSEKGNKAKLLGWRFDVVNMFVPPYRSKGSLEGWDFCLPSL